MAILLGTLAININLSNFIASTFVMYPVYYFYLEMNSYENILTFLQTFTYQLVTLMATFYQVFLLCDASMYFIDGWILLLFPILYNLWTFLFYIMNDTIMYPLWLNWRTWEGVGVAAGATVGAGIGLVMSNALISGMV